MLSDNAPLAQWIARLTSNQKVLGSSPRVGNCQCVRVVKETDLKSVGIFPRRFESCR